MTRSWIKCADDTLILSVFALCVVYGIMWFVDMSMPMQGLMLWGGTHINFVMLYVLQFVLVYHLIWKSYRFRTCSITKIATWQYAALVLVNLIYYIFPTPYAFRMDIVQLVLIGGMSAMVMIYLLQKISRWSKFSKK